MDIITKGLTLANLFVKIVDLKKTSGGFGISEGTLHNKIDALIAEEEKKIKQAKNKQKTTAQKAQPYIDAGLAEPFALAIARGVDDSEVMDLWEAKWWKQYPPEDILICSILDGELTEEEGRYLNEIRSDGRPSSHVMR